LLTGNFAGADGFAFCFTGVSGAAVAGIFFVVVMKISFEINGTNKPFI
jgi:hypothetical protein